MTGIVDWAAGRARMIVAFIILSLLAGGFSYVGLPKEGEPDIEIPALVVSVPFPGISAEDAEKLIVKPMETELSDLDGLKEMLGPAAEGYANIVLEFDFRDQLLGIPDHHREPHGPRARTHIAADRQGLAGSP